MLNPDNTLQSLPAIGLYRHFKTGNYYFLQNIVSDCNSDGKKYLCVYFNVCNPEQGTFSRRVEDWNNYVVYREDNLTGQTYRFELVKSIDFQISSITTEQLIRELRTRKDSPIHALNLKGMMSPIVSQDYVVGEYFNDEEVKGVSTICAHDTLEQAKKYFATHKLRDNARVFKRTFIQID